MLNVGKYIPYMDPMGYITSTKHQTHGLKLEKTLQPSNISTTKKPCHTPWQSWDAQEIPTMDPSKKKTRNGIPMVSQVRCPDRIWMQISGPQASTHRGRVPIVSRIPKSAMNSFGKGLLNTAFFFFSKGTFCSKQVILFINTKLGDVKCVFFCFFWKRHAIETR